MICVSVQEKSFGDCRAILESCEMAELRADLCRLSVEEVERLVEIRPNLIATCRIANSSETFAREQLEAAIRRGARYVDIEIEAPDEHLEYIRTLAREYGCRLIVSFHDFEGTPSLDELKGIARLCRTKGADLVKIVTTARNISDAARTMRLYDLQADGALFEGAAAAERPQLVAFRWAKREIHPSALPEARCALYVCFSWSIQRHGVGAIYPRGDGAAAFGRIILSRDFASSVGRRLPFLVPRAWLSGPCWLLRWLRERAGSPITPLATI